LKNFTLEEVRGSSAIGHKEVLQYVPRRWYDALFLVRSPTCSSASLQPVEKRKEEIVFGETDGEGTVTSIGTMRTSEHVCTCNPDKYCPARPENT
jgi:hypothetical protein